MVIKNLAYHQKEALRYIAENQPLPEKELSEAMNNEKLGLVTKWAIVGNLQELGLIESWEFGGRKGRPKEREFLITKRGEDYLKNIKGEGGSFRSD